MTAHGASSSSSSMSKLWNHHVFLSFSSVGTRNGFPGELHAALKARGYQVYIDEDDVERGEEIREELFQGIEESRISIMVFSKSYADSIWCLDELVKIIECRSKLGSHVLPVFYHVDPSHVRKQDGDVAQAFQKHAEGIGEEKDDKKPDAKRERVKQWREALTEAANLSGHHLQITDNGCEAKLIREIVDKITMEWLLSTNELNVAKHLVGINSCVQDTISHLSGGGSNDIVMVGIWGMGGIGKTTIAKAVYNQIHPKFEFKSFLADVCDTSSKHGLVYLLEIQVSYILKQTKSQMIHRVDGGISLIKQQFRHRRVIISEKSPGHPGKWSSLWNCREVTDVLTNKSEEVEGLDLATIDCFSTVAFATRKKLLQLYNVELNGEYKHLPKELIWLCWSGCPFESKPDDFSQVPNLEELILQSCTSLSKVHPSIGHLKTLSWVNLQGYYNRRSLPELSQLPSLVNLQGYYNLRSIPGDFFKSKSVETLCLNQEKLVTLDMQFSNLGQVWEGSKSFQKMKMIDLNCPYSPELSQLPNLEELILKSCTSLSKIHPSIGHLKRLSLVNLENCNSSEIHPSIGHLKRLSLANLENCNSLSSLPGDFYKDDGHGWAVLQDRISNLPHEILVRIVSLLPLKEAAATSILSRPWRYVWTFTTTLSFENVNFEVGDTLHRFLDLEEQVRDRESGLYVSWVNKVLDQHKGQCIERFRVWFFLQRDFAGSIDKWIQIAMGKRVQILELELLTDSIVFLDDNYTFPHKLLLGPEKHSNLPSGCSIAPFKSLRVVRFQHVGVTGEALEFLLSNCPVLERLSLSFAKDLVELRVIGPSIALKYLEIKYCRELSMIEISGANIVSFIYCGQLIDLRLNNVPLLVEVSIYKWGTFAEFTRLALSQLSCCLSHLETLKLDIRGAVYNQNHVFPALSNLKHLELLVDAEYRLSLGRLASFMKAAAYLRSLVLGLGFRTSNKDMATVEKVSKQPHHCLKAVEIAGYRGHKCCVKHARYLLKNAVALEKIVINPVRFWCRPTGIESNALLENEEENARDHAIQHLKKKVPSGVEFVCL